MKVPFVLPKYDVRWRLDYRDGTKTKLGFWTREADNLKDMATFKRTDGLAKAFIEVKDKETGVIATPVHCAGHDFCLFKWRKVARIGLGTKGKVSGEIVALVLVTRTMEATFYVDGTLRTDIRTDEEKKFHYEGYGR